MKKLPLFFLLIMSLTVKSQHNDALYVFDEDWKPVDIKYAHFLLHTHQLNDTCWQWDYYNFVGPLIKTEQYLNKDGSVRNGVSNYYNEAGYMDSLTNFSRGKRNGDSWKMDEDSFKFNFKYVYQDDSLIEFIDINKQKKDSSLSYPDEKESEFPGGTAGWLRYLTKKLVYPERAINGNIQGQVRIGFVVDKAGVVIDPYIAKSVEYSMDEEALKIVRNSGKWVPAFQNGHYVKSYKLQPLNFRLQ